MTIQTHLLSFLSACGGLALLLLLIGVVLVCTGVVQWQIVQANGLSLVLVAWR